MNREDRIKAYEYMVEIGLIVQEKSFIELETDEERIERITKLVKDGFRIQKYGDEVCPIYLNGSMSLAMEKELLAIYEWSKQ